MTILQAIILGIVEGATEFLPISSTAHLVLAAKTIGVEQSEFAKTFEIAVQSGAIAAVVVVYGKKLCTDVQTLVKVLAAFLPTAIIGLLAHKLVKDVFLESTNTILGALAIGGVVLIVFEMLFRANGNGPKEVRDISIAKAVMIGMFQSLAIVPGVSRAAATVIGGMLIGIPRITTVEFSFFLAVPTILAATALDIANAGTTFTAGEWQILGIGAVTAFVVALAVIRWFVRFIQHHSFIPFGIERIAIAAAFLLLQ